jgi:hypothetical protein
VRWSRAIFVGVGVGVSVVLVAACNGGGAHIFSAYQYDPTRSCLEDQVAIDVINSGQTSYSCAPECFIVPGTCGTSTIYVSNQCPPYPFFAGPGFVSESAAEAGNAGDPCAAALQAFAAFDGGTCPAPDGGSLNECDDASEASAASDASDASEAPDVMDERD